MIVCGDWNIAHTEADIWNPKGNKKNSGFLPEEREWFSEVLALGWSDVFREQHPDEAGLYSWWSNRGQARAHDKGWRLDYVLATPELAGRAVSARIDKTAGLSDHAPVIVEFTV
jgi:exodeoxyribonuclease-3